MAVAAMAISIGKKMAKTGMRSVPKPKPEKKVRPATTRATTQIIRYSIMISSSPLLCKEGVRGR